MTKAKLALVRVIPGFHSGEPQPRIYVRLELSEIGTVALDRVAQILSTDTHKFNDVSAFDLESLAHQLVAVTHKLLLLNGFPFACEPVIRQSGLAVFDIRFPVTQGCSNSTVKLMAYVLDALISDLEVNDLITKLKRYLAGFVDKHAPQGINTLPLLNTAYSMGLPVYRVSHNIYQFGQGRKQHWFDSSCSDLTPALGVKSCRNKLLSKQLLKRSGLPVAIGWQVNSEDEAIRSAEDIGFPVVIKPIDLDKGLGVNSLINDKSALIDAYHRAKDVSDHLMIEALIPGADHRVHVLQGKAYRVRLRTPGGVVGDGKSSIKALLEILNSDPRRGERESRKELVRIDLNDEAIYMLNLQNLNADSIPEKGRFIQLRTTANVSTGGISEEVPLTAVHPDNLAVAERAVSLFNLDIAAVDFITPDITQSWLDLGGGICEVNAIPQFGADAPAKVIKAFLPDGGHIPIGLVLGNHGKLSEETISKDLALKGVNLAYADKGSTLKIAGKPMVSLAGHTSFEQGLNLISHRDVDAILLKADESLELNGHFSNKASFVLLTEWPLRRTSTAFIRAIVLMSEHFLVMDHLSLMDLPADLRERIQLVNKVELESTLKKLMFR